MSSQYVDLLRSIANTIADYRQGEIDPIDQDHVERWVKQFDRQDQMTILAQMDSILKRFYYSREQVKQWLHTLLLHAVIADQHSWQIIDPSQPLDIQQKQIQAFLLNVRRKLVRPHFLNIQKKGESQRALLGIMNEILEEWYDTSLIDCGKEPSDTYVYLDDGIYTGNRLRYDLAGADDTDEGCDSLAWIPRLAPSGCKLVILILAEHAAGFLYASQHIDIAARTKGISVDYVPTKIIYNLREQSDKFECLWPDRSTANGDDPDAGWYVKRILWWCNKNEWSKSLLTRSPNIPTEETLFSSPAARNIVESAFFRAGARILKPSHRLGESRRPLGWEKLESWGFGTFFVTYRNIANNCPMVLWSKAAGWYPLFPRKPNSETDGYDD